MALFTFHGFVFSLLMWSSPCSSLTFHYVYITSSQGVCFLMSLVLDLLRWLQIHLFVGEVLILPAVSILGRYTYGKFLSPHSSSLQSVSLSLILPNLRISGSAMGCRALSYLGVCFKSLVVLSRNEVSNPGNNPQEQCDLTQY